jgi:protein-tyrosine phosphatase
MMGEIVKMIDLHTHILPGLDDGAKTLEESVQMCWMSFRDGVRTIVATPHTLNGLYLNDRDIILKKVDELNEALIHCGLRISDCGIKNSKSEIDFSSINSEFRIPNSEFRILPGSDVRLCENTLSHLDQGKVMTISDSKKYLFLEFPFQGIPHQAEEIIFQVMQRGMIPIITHPERNIELGQRPRRYYEMIRKGCLGQVTAMSLTGELGPRIKQVAERLLTNRLIHFIASDAHSLDGRPPILSEAVRVAGKIVGKEEAQKMVTEYPQAILDGRKPDVPEPIPI